MVKLSTHGLWGMLVLMLADLIIFPRPLAIQDRTFSKYQDNEINP